MNADALIARIRSHWALKIGLGTGLIAMFALLYLVPQRWPVFPATPMKELWVDRMIPFVPRAVYVYESLYLLLPVAPWLMTSKPALARYAKGLVLMSLVGFCFFFFYPTLSPRPQDVHDANLLYRTLIRHDNAYNAFPSLHVAYAVFHSACCHALFCRRPGYRIVPWIVWVWALGIAVSTLLTKQHVVVDVIGGAVLGAGSYAICCRPDKMPTAGTRRT